MAFDPEDDLPKKPSAATLTLGSDLSALSAFELEARIADMEAEITRCRDAIKARAATKSAADAFFKH